MFERPCGGCTMCCKLPAAPPSTQLPEGKPAGVWCQHCDKGKGCRIYADRPQGCRDFMCLWKVMPDFPEELRPDKCKVMWQLTEDGTRAVATTEYPDKAQAQLGLIRSFLRAGIAVEIRT